MIPAIQASQFTETLLALLRVEARGRGTLKLRWRTLGGIGAGEFIIRPGLERLPLPLLDLLDQNLEIRSAIATSEDDGRPVALTAAAVLFNPQTRFSKETGWKQATDPDAAEKIRATLEAFPLRPAYLADGGHEVAAWWPLKAPLCVDRDPVPALELLAALAKHLEADPDAALSLATAYPTAGIIRNWTNQPTERIELLAIAPGAMYSVEELLQALDRQDPDPHTTAPAVRSRRAKAQ